MLTAIFAQHSHTENTQTQSEPFLHISYNVYIRYQTSFSIKVQNTKHVLMSAQTPRGPTYHRISSTMHILLQTTKCTLARWTLSIEMLPDSKSGRRGTVSISKSRIQLKLQIRNNLINYRNCKIRNSTAHLSYKYLAFQNLSALINRNIKCKIFNPENLTSCIRNFNLKTKNNILK